MVTGAVLTLSQQAVNAGATLWAGAAAVTAAGGLGHLPGPGGRELRGQGGPEPP